MSVLDKLDNVEFDVSTIVNPNLRERISNAKDLVTGYINIVSDAHKMLSAMNLYQTEVLSALSPSLNNDFSKFFDSTHNSNEGFSLRDFTENQISKFVSSTILAINEEYGISFTIPTDLIEKEFTENGININLIYGELFKYLDGKTFEQLLVQEVTDKMWDLNKIHWVDKYATYDTILSKYSKLEVNDNQTEITLVNFSYAYRWDTTVDPTNFIVLNKYFQHVLNEKLTETESIPIGLNQVFKPKNSIVKSIRVFKSGKVKIVFHTVEGTQKFLQPFVDKAEELEHKSKVLETKTN